MTRPVRKNPTRWHHPDLRRALLAAALTAIEKKGVDAVNIRQLAARTGVSTATPYHHFASRQALLVALAADGFQLLQTTMHDEAERHEDPIERLAGLGRGYVRFALQHPGYFRVMYLPEVKRSEDPALVLQGGLAMTMLEDTVIACQQAGLAPAGNPRPLVLLAWSAVHGMATLWSAGSLEPGLSREEAEQTVANTVAALIRAARKQKMPSGGKKVPTKFSPTS